MVANKIQNIEPGELQLRILHVLVNNEDLKSNLLPEHFGDKDYRYFFKTIESMKMEGIPLEPNFVKNRSEGKIPASLITKVYAAEGFNRTKHDWYEEQLISHKKISDIKTVQALIQHELESPEVDLTKIQKSLQEAGQNLSGIYSGKDPIKIWSQSELLQTEFPKMEWLVFMLIPKGNVVVLAGAPKLGKSWLSFCLGDSVSNGSDFLTFQSSQYDVLILSLETSPSRDAERFRKMKATPNDNLYIAHEWPKGASGIAALKTWLDEHPNAGLIVVDTWVKMASRHDMNDYSAVSHEAGVLKSLAAEYDVTIILLHHTRKGSQSEDPFDSIMGSQGLSGIADTMMVLKKRRGNHEAILAVTGREITENEYVIEFDPESCSWGMVGRSSEVAEQDSSQPIIDYLKKNGDSNTQAIADAVGKSKQNVSNILGRMVDKGQVVKIRRGVYNLPLEESFTPFTSLQSDFPESETINGEYTCKPSKHPSQTKEDTETLELMEIESESKNSIPLF